MAWDVDFGLPSPDVVLLASNLSGFKPLKYNRIQYSKTTSISTKQDWLLQNLVWQFLICLVSKMSNVHWHGWPVLQFHLYMKFSQFPEYLNRLCLSLAYDAPRNIVSKLTARMAESAPTSAIGNNPRQIGMSRKLLLVPRETLSNNMLTFGDSGPVTYSHPENGEDELPGSKFWESIHHVGAGWQQGRRLA